MIMFAATMSQRYHGPGRRIRATATGDETSTKVNPRPDIDADSNAKRGSYVRQYRPHRPSQPSLTARRLCIRNRCRPSASTHDPPLAAAMLSIVGRAACL